MLVVGLLKKKSGLTDREFRDYYENNHVPLVLRTIPYIADYKRKYVVRDDARSPVHGNAGEPSVAFDAIAEMRFATRADYERMLADLGDPAIAAPLIEDEKRFLDRDGMVVSVMEETSSDIAGITN